MAGRIGKFIVQLIFLPISFIINIMVLMPVLFFTSDFEVESALGGLIVSILACLAGCALNRFFYWLKGKKVDETYLTWVTHDVVTDVKVDVKESADAINITTTKYYTPISSQEYKTSLTLWGWIASILSFIAFPMRLVSVFMAFLSLLFSRVFVTARRLNDKMPKNKLAVFTHTLFDFVILPKTSR